jgi:hypothetical protein
MSEDEKRLSVRANERELYGIWPAAVSYQLSASG